MSKRLSHITAAFQAIEEEEQVKEDAWTEAIENAASHEVHVARPSWHASRDPNAESTMPISDYTIRDVGTAIFGMSVMLSLVQETMESDQNKIDVAWVAERMRGIGLRVREMTKDETNGRTEGTDQSGTA